MITWLLGQVFPQDREGPPSTHPPAEQGVKITEKLVSSYQVHKCHCGFEMHPQMGGGGRGSFALCLGFLHGGFSQNRAPQ